MRKLWFTSGSGRIELQMTLEQAQSVSHSGQCDEDVLALSKVPEIAAQLEAIELQILANELREYGAWDTEQLQDHAQNLQRILWIAGNDIAENEDETELDYSSTHNIDIAYARACGGHCADCGATPDECIAKPCKYDSSDCELMEVKGTPPLGEAMGTCGCGRTIYRSRFAGTPYHAI